MTSDTVVVAAFDALIALDTPFMISGSLASSFYGVPRATQDADLVLELDRLSPERLSTQLGDRFDVAAQIALETVMGSRRVLVRARDSAFQVELFDVTDDPHDRERFARRKTVAVLERRVSVPTAEDVVINKLRWSKVAGRRKDWDDARNVVAVQSRRLDQAYLRAWCERLELVDQLETLERSLPDRR